jgi:hypothetical protein
LPVLEHLQGTTHDVGVGNVLRGGTARYVQHDLTNRRGRVLAVAEQIFEGGVPADRLVHAIGLDQVEQWSRRQAIGDQARQTRHRRKASASGPQRADVSLDRVQQRQPITHRSVADVIDEARVAVGVHEVFASTTRQNPQCYGEVLGRCLGFGLVGEIVQHTSLLRRRLGRRATSDHGVVLSVPLPVKPNVATP